jgi:hypothetical protein
MSYLIIRGFEKLGNAIHYPLIWNVLVPTTEDIQKRLQKQELPKIMPLTALKVADEEKEVSLV